MPAPKLPAVPLLCLRGLHKSHDGATPTLRNLSLELAAGELLALLGPPGAGKTTLLMLLAGFTRPDRGEIILAERSLARLRPQRRDIGAMLPGHALFDHLTVAENLAFPLHLRGVARALRSLRVARTLALLHLADAAGSMPAELSPLQRRRAALARALVIEPRLLLLDAPLAGLDPTARDAFLSDIARVHDQLGVTVIHATDDAAEALALAGRIIAGRIGVLAEGTLRQVGGSQALYDDPADAIVDRIIGESNHLPGHVEAIEDDIATVRLACGPLVEARVADAQPGRRCVVSVRPERVAVAAVSAEEMGEGALPATLIEALPRGDHVRLRLGVGLAGAPPAEIVVRRPAGMAALAPGEPAAIAWQPYHARAFQPAPGH